MWVISSLLVTVLLAASPDGGSLLGPIWGGDDSEDAGSSSRTSRQIKLGVASSSGVSLTKIVGTTVGLGLAATDSVDMYVVRISDPTEFCVNTEGSSFNTVLWLFRKVELANGDLVAIPVVANDNAFQGVTYSSISQPVQMQGDDGIPGISAGEYFLAVSGRGTRALSCSTGGGYAEIFEFPANDGTGLAFPFPNQAQSPLCDWSEGSTPGGDYEVNVCGGVAADPPRTCAEAPLLTIGEHPFGSPEPLPEQPATLGTQNACGTPGFIVSPNWFRVEGCNGLVTIDICPNGDAASQYGLLVFRGGCGSLTPVACGTLDARCGASGTTVTFASQGCSDVIVGYGPLSGPGGGGVTGADGVITISCQPVQQTADLNGDGAVTGADLCILLSQWTGGEGGGGHGGDDDDEDGNDDDDDDDDDDKGDDDDDKKDDDFAP